MLETLTIDSFAPHIGTSFWVHEGTQKVEMRLLKASPVMESEAARLTRTAFSLFFLGPKSLLLPQQIYHLKHEAAFPDGIDIFIVPVGEQKDGYLYEAVFT